ncbi:MAG: hypothetical protein HFF24_07620 [Oscillospiraceae bacterium]|nr:hypothetical protein [Oscillospiraceae bacterium]
MHVDIAGQAAVFGQALLLGALLGLVYDAMRTLRRTWRSAGLAFALDLLFWLGATAALFLLTLSRDDGRVRIFHMAAVALGGGAYFLTLSRLALPALLWAAGLARRIWRLLTAPLRALARWTKKFLENRKKLFQNWLAWYKINMVYRFLENGKEGAAGYETQTGGRRHKNTRAGAAGRGGHRSAVHTGPAQRRPGGPGGAQPPGSGAEGGQRRFGRGHRPKRRH